MRLMLAGGVLLASTAVLAAQDAPDVPKDSALVTVRGCADDRAFIVAPRTEDQPGTIEIEPGRRFRLTGDKKVLDEVKKRERMMVELTGLIRASQVAPQGIGLFGGRIRIGGARVPQDPITDPRRDPAYNVTVLDVRSWRPVDEPCPD